MSTNNRENLTKGLDLARPSNHPFATSCKSATGMTGSLLSEPKADAGQDAASVVARLGPINCL